MNLVTRFSINPPIPEAQILAGEALFSSLASFSTSVYAIEQLPPADRIEICLAGRSNSGKSSLINALVGQNGLAHASNTPGRTQSLNYFSLENRPLWLVDLPGYGYALAPKSIVKNWQKLLKAYMQGRPSLRRVFVLVDSRHGIKEADQEIMTLLDMAAVSFQIVLTKIDKPRPAELQEVLQRLPEQLRGHGAVHPHIRMTSSLTRAGIAELRAEVLSLLQPVAE